MEPFIEIGPIIARNTKTVLLASDTEMQTYKDDVHNQGPNTIQHDASAKMPLN